MGEFEEIRSLLAEKLIKEKKRLKTYGTRASAFDYANCISHNVRSLCSGARYSELKALTKFIETHDIEWHRRLKGYVNERKQALKTMRDAIQKYADDIESKRPRKHKKHKKEKKHGSHRSSRSS